MRSFQFVPFLLSWSSIPFEMVAIFTIKCASIFHRIKGRGQSWPTASDIMPIVYDEKWSCYISRPPCHLLSIVNPLAIADYHSLGDLIPTQRTFSGLLVDTSIPCHSIKKAVR
jgi:hypothetical protein